MKYNIKNNMKMLWLFLLLLPSSLFAWHWADLWQTHDQQGAQLLRSGNAQLASRTFKNKKWRAVATYRAKDYANAFQQFKQQKTSDGQYNAGNAAAYSGKYQTALAAYEKAIELNPNNADAVFNRDIIKKLLQKQKKQQQSKSNSKSDSNQKSSSNSKKESKSSAKNNQSKNNDQADNNRSSTKPSQPENNQKNNTNQSNSGQSKGDSLPKPSNQKTAAANQDRINQENQNQLLRRLSDNPGGLLRQKFLRDYVKRHGADTTGEFN